MLAFIVKAAVVLVLFPVAAVVAAFVLMTATMIVGSVCGTLVRLTDGPDEA